MRIEPRCRPFEGRPAKYQNHVGDLWIHYHDKTLDHLSYLIPTCETEMCTEVEHLEVVFPTKLHYPHSVCIYCGNPGYTKDHILPRTWSGEAARRGVFTVPACGECNSAISDAYAPSITLRREIAHKFLRKRYRSTLNMIDPSPAELDEYGPGLKAYLVNALAEREIIRDRLNWPPVGFDERAAEQSGIDPWESGLIHGLH